MPVLRLWATPVRIHLSVFALVALLALLHQAGRGVALIASVLLHELGHAYCARRLGVRVYEVELMPFGGVAHLDEPAMVEPGREIRIALAGPLVNALLAASGTVALRSGSLPDTAAWRVLIGDQAAMALFNLLPFFPLDGGRVLRAVLVPRLGLPRASRVAVSLGRVAGWCMAAAGLATYIWSGSGLWAAAMAGFVLYAAEQERRRAPGVWVRYLYRLVEEHRPTRGVREVRALAAPGQTPVREVAAYWVPGRYHLVLLTDARGRAVGVADEQDLVAGLLQGGPRASLESLAHRRL